MRRASSLGQRPRGNCPAPGIFQQGLLAVKVDIGLVASLRVEALVHQCLLGFIEHWDVNSGLVVFPSG